MFVELVLPVQDFIRVIMHFSEKCLVLFLGAAVLVLVSNGTVLLT